MLKIEKISDTEFAVGGVEEVFISNYKQVVVDGITYSNNGYERTLLDFSKDRIENPQNWESLDYYYPAFSIDYKFYFNARFDRLIKVCLPVYYSTNDWVNCFKYILSEVKPPNIKGFYLTRSNVNNIQDFKHLSIPIPLDSIAGGNYFYIEVPFVEIVKMDWTLLELTPKNYLETLFFDNEYGKEFWIDLLPHKIKQEKLTLDEVNFVLMELYQRKAKLFTTVPKYYNKNQYIINKLNKKCYL